MLYGPIVFAAGSLSNVPSEWLQRIDLRPPAKRGDLDRLRSSRKRGTVILLEGLFGASMAVTPTECRDLIAAGWFLVGASSMGALRASELWSVGMLGLGNVFAMFRAGKLRSDADVSVCYSPIDWSEITVSLVHVRAVVGELEAEGLIGGLTARKLLRIAGDIHWTSRTWDDVIDRSGAVLPVPAVERYACLARNPGLHPKVQDARNALALILSHRWPQRMRVDVAH